MEKDINVEYACIYDEKKRCFMLPKKTKEKKGDKNENDKVEDKENDKEGDKNEKDKVEEKENDKEGDKGSDKVEEKENDKEEDKGSDKVEGKENDKKEDRKNGKKDDKNEEDEISFETLYKSNNYEKIKSGEVEYILYDNYYYPFVNPGNINFIFPDGVEKSIFVPRNNCIFELFKSYKNYKYLVKKSGQEIFEESKIKFKDKYSEIKILPLFIKPEEYNKSNRLINLKSNQESLSVLSPVFDVYFDDKIIAESNPTFKYTNERKQFFEFLENEIEENQLIPICGPEGIGKTISILAFFRERQYEYNYIYCNMKKLYYFFCNKNLLHLKKLMINELFHCITLDCLNQNLKELEKIFQNPKHPIDMIEEIIKLLDLNNIVIILDQYKIKYDDNYLKLKKLRNITSDRGIKLIVVSSMNEFDIKESIVENLEKKEKKTGFSLHYIYIAALVLCHKEDESKLDEEEKEILKKFGNTYQSYYEILKQKNNYKNCKTSESFKQYFKSQMQKNFEERVNVYFNNEEDNKDMQTKLHYLINCTMEELPIKSFLANANNIPFRFFIFNYKNETVFKISDIKDTDTISLKYQCKEHLHFLGSMHSKLSLKNIEADHNKSSYINQKASNFESTFNNFLWCSELDFQKINVIRRNNIQQFFKINEKDFDLNSLNNGEAILFYPSDQNAKLFDSGLLLCIDKSKGKYDLYIFQVTRTKKADERLSYLALNDNLNYLKLYYMQSLGIIIDKVFFCLCI